MHVQQSLSPGPLMQIIDILCDDQELARKLRIKPGQRMMRGIGLFAEQGLTPHVIKAQNQIGVAREPLRRRNIFNIVLFPQSTGIAECIYSTFGADPCACQDNDVANIGHVAHEAYVA